MTHRHRTTISGRQFLLTCIVIFFLPLLCSEAATRATLRPNIILIMVDDISPDMYGAYGNETIETPNIDRMARNGVMFRTAWATPMCSPTRAMIMSGRYAQRTLYYHNGLKLTEDPNLLRDHLTFGKLLKRAGYATAIAGKWGVTGDPPHSENGGFDEHSLWCGPRYDPEAGFAGLWENETTPSRYWHPCIVQNHQLLETRPENFGTAIHTDFIRDFIARKRDEPFFVYFSMAAVHGARKGFTTNPLRGAARDIEPNSEEEAAARFKSLNEFVDLSVGRILEKLDELGLGDRTVVIFTSDNGSAATAKARAVERGCRVPLVVYGAGIKQRGVSEELTDLTDILPTLLDFASVGLPDGYEVDGHSLAPYLRGETDHHTREWIYSYIGTSQMLRDKRWLLEALNPLLGSPRGRFYDTGGDREGKGYRDVTESNEPDVLAARKRFEQILSRFPAIQSDHPYWQTDEGAKFLERYIKPRSARIHLSNHEDYQYELVD